jgi:hypothetical protein
MPRLALTQVNVMGIPEAERQVQGMQDQLVHLSVDVQEIKAQFQAEAAAHCEGRAQDRQIYCEAFMMAERFYEQKAHQFAEDCQRFLQEEVQQLSRKHVQEDATFQRLCEHEIQKAREFEMRANAIKNQEVSVSQERYVAQQEVQHLHKERFQRVSSVFIRSSLWTEISCLKYFPASKLLRLWKNTVFWEAWGAQQLSGFRSTQNSAVAFCASAHRTSFCILHASRMRRVSTMA